MYHNDLKKHYHKVPLKPDDFCIMCLQRLIALRIIDNYNDSYIVSELYKQGFLTKEMIMNEISQPTYFADVSFFSLTGPQKCVIMAISKLAIEEDEAHYIIVDYYSKALFNTPVPKSRKHALKFSWDDKLDETQELFFAYTSISEYRIKDGIYDEKLTVERVLEMVWYRLMTTVKFPYSAVCKNITLEQTISDYLGDDLANGEQRLLNRYVTRRFNELLNFVISKSPSKKDASSLSMKDKICLVLFSAVGIHIEQIFRDTGTYNSLLNKGFVTSLKKTDKGKNMETPFKKDKSENSDNPVFAVEFLAPLNKITFGAVSDCLSKISPDVYNYYAYANGYISCYMSNTICNSKDDELPFIREAILGDLLNRITEAYYSDNCENFTKEQIVRGITYNEADCRLILESIKGIVCVRAVANMAEEQKETDIKEVLFPEWINNSLRNMTLDFDAESADKSKGSRMSQIDSTIKHLQDELKKTKQSLSSTTNNLDKEREKNRCLVQKLSKTESREDVISELRQQNNSLIDEIESLKRQLTDSQIQIELFRQKEEESDSADIGSAFDDEYFKPLRLLVIGGRWEVHRKLRKLMPKCRIIDKLTDDDADVRQYDGVFFFTDYLPHPLFYPYRDAAKRHNIRTHYLTGSNWGNIKQEIYEFMERNRKLAAVS